MDFLGVLGGQAEGLPQAQAWWTVKRQAMTRDSRDPLGLYFGTTSGELWMSRDEGEIVTPTGAALMKALASELPAEAPFIPGRIVYAAGTRERHPGPGMLRAIEAKSAGRISAR